ncbi:hypothetical protein [Longimicrobium sp.]|uniref:hypothetical protein n=1 Tax=Longimicrobium sp. TaxID=2029185 RepID=UPI002BF23145|nr:hypothetical protein [Longimicrobium sp.]HSU16908.1 hypothetical protein [Longimicrobium sp.]
MPSSREHFERAREIIEKYRPDPVKTEALRKKTLLALLTVNDIYVPNAEQLDSAALRQVLDAATGATSEMHPNGR